MVDITKLTKEDVARKLDYSLVTRPEFKNDVYMDAIENVKKYKFGGFVLLPCFIPMVMREIGTFCKENDILIGTGIGFPFGTHTTKTKLCEAEEMIDMGCTALDMVSNVNAFKEGDYKYYQNELTRFAKMCERRNVLTRVIIYVGYLTDEEIRKATKMVADCGIDYVKTETGVGMPGRPTIQDVYLMLDTLAGMNTKCQLKATSGRVSDVYTFIQAGAAVIGTNIGPAVVDALPEMKKRLYGV